MSEPTGNDSLRRRCVYGECENDARPSGKDCRAHHAEANAAWRRRNPRVATPSPADRSTRKVRVALLRAIRRGAIAKGPCAACGSGPEGVVGIRIGPAPADVLWACRSCRNDVLRRHAAKVAADRAAAAAREYVSDEAIARRRSAIDRLDEAPPEVAASIRAEAAAFRGMTLSPESPLYRQRLAAIAERRLA